MPILVNFKNLLKTSFNKMYINITRHKIKKKNLVPITKNISWLILLLDQILSKAILADIIQQLDSHVNIPQITLFGVCLHDKFSIM